MKNKLLLSFRSLGQKVHIIKRNFTCVFFVFCGLALFFCTHNVNATSGTCSDHGGINCYAGADWDGSAICNDGWNDSSESFFSAKECSSMVRCSSSQFDSLMQKYGVSELMAEIQSDIQKISDINIQIANLETEKQTALMNNNNRQAPMSFIEGEGAKIEKEYNIKINSFSQQADAIGQEVKMRQSNLDQINSVIDSECRALGYNNENQRMLDKIKIHEELMNQLLANVCQANSHSLNGQCICNEGYLLFGNSCLTYTQICQNQYGANSYGDKNYCYCNADYEMNSTKTACIKKSNINNNVPISSFNQPKPEPTQQTVLKPITVKPLNTNIKPIITTSSVVESIKASSTPNITLNKVADAKEQKPEPIVKKQKFSLFASISIFFTKISKWIIGIFKK